MSSDLATALAQAIARSFDTEPLEWFELARARARSPTQHAGFLADFARAGRKIDVTEIALARDEATECPQRCWPGHRAARCALLLAHLGAHDAAHARPCLDDLYYRGALEERAAVLASLAYVPTPPNHLVLAIDACRTNAVAEFAALATHNPYAARYFDDAAFGQLVLKSIFVDIALVDIVDLDRRHSPALHESVAALVRERQAAGRPIRPDVEAFLSRAPHEAI